MSLSLSNLKPAKGATKKRKDIGRGGKRGTYSGRGMKGQKARSGVSGLKALGMKQVIRRIPKNRGFKSMYTKLTVVNLADLEKVFNANDKVDAKILAASGLIGDAKEKIKILGNGTLKKRLIVVANAFSASAKQAIEEAGGQAEIKK